MKDKIEVRQTNEQSLTEEVTRMENLGYFQVGDAKAEDGKMTQVMVRDVDHD